MGRHSLQLMASLQNYEALGEALRECILMQDSSGMSLAMLAAAGGQDDILRLLIKKGARVNGRQKNGSTALMHAAEKVLASGPCSLHTYPFFICHFYTVSPPIQCSHTFNSLMFIHPFQAYPCLSGWKIHTTKLILFISCCTLLLYYINFSNHCLSFL